MQVAATSAATVQPRLGHLDGTRQQGAETATRQTTQGRADIEARADNLRQQQAETTQAVRQSPRAAEPEPQPDLVAEGGTGMLRGSRIDITI